MLRHNYIVSLVLKWLGAEFSSFCICQHEICPECSVCLFPHYVTLEDFCKRMGRQGKINHLINSLHNVIQQMLPACLFSTVSRLSLCLLCQIVVYHSNLRTGTVCSWPKHCNIIVHYFNYSGIYIGF
jgi:hypothetical protein